MPNILLYIPPPFKDSGGLGNFKLFFDICKKLGYSIYFCPLLKNITSLNFNTPFNDRDIESISHSELINYYINCPAAIEYIHPNDIVTPTILKARNNVVIYPEDVIGNPAQQSYVVRWLFYFPIPTAIQYYNFNNDYIWFYSDYIYNFYKYVCIACGMSDNLTNNLKEINVCRVFKFEPDVYANIVRKPSLSQTNMENNNKCFTLRKLFPPVSFDSFNKGVNVNYGKEILQIYKNKINALEKKIQNNNSPVFFSKYINELNTLTRSKPDLSSNSVIREFLSYKFKSMGYDHIEHQPSSTIFMHYFQTKDYFLSFDPFTFMSIIASLSGCVSVVKKIWGLNFDDWVNGDPFNKYGVAYGNEGVKHALETHHLLLPHITEMYNQNENNVLNFITSIETRFNIKIN